MHRYKLRSLAFLLLLLMSFFVAMPTAKAANTDSAILVSTPSDGDTYVTGELGVPYVTVWNETTGIGVSNTSGTMQLGQQEVPPQFTVSRCFVYFNTSIVPDDATILSADLTLTIYQDESDQDFAIRIQNGQPTYPHDPLVVGDYNRAHYSQDGGWIGTSGLSELTPFNITLTKLSWINKTGTTKLALRSTRDCNGQAPVYPNDEYLWLYTRDTPTPAYKPQLTVTWSLEYFYFYGVYDETTGILKDPSERAVNVTAYFTDGSSPQIFEVNGSYTLSLGDTHPEYFLFNLTNTRQYWLNPTEVGISIYIFDEGLTTYTIEFVDLAGVLDSYPYVEAQRYINGTLHTVEKRKVDEENKILMNLVNGEKYTIAIGNGVSYTFGDVLMTSVTTLTLTLKGIDFPETVILAYRYVRLYAERHNNFSSISCLYEDLDENTNYVDIFINYRNGTNAYNNTQTGVNSFNVTWTSANYNITYVVQMNAYHNDYGTLNYRAPMHRGGYGQTWNLSWLGSIGDFNVSDLLSIFLIFCVAGVFSKVNAPLAALLATGVAMLLSHLGWYSVAPAYLTVALFLSIFMGLAYKKYREYGT